jgi:hypothetical protein
MSDSITVPFPFDPNDILWFVAKLRTQGIDINARPESPVSALRDLGFTAAVMNTLNGMTPAGVHTETPVPLATLSEAAATAAMLRALRHTEELRPEVLVGVWEKVAAGSAPAAPQSRTIERDLTWEIFNACIYAQFAERVLLNSNQDGVDLHGDFGSVSWGLECKALYSTNAQRRGDRIIEGVKQLEADTSVRKGIVAVNVTDCLDHAPFQASLTSTSAMFANSRDALATLKDAVKTSAMAVLTPTFNQRLVANSAGTPRQKCRAVVFVAQTVAAVAGEVRVFTSQFSSLRRPSEPADRFFVERYHGSLLALQYDTVAPQQMLTSTADL